MASTKKAAIITSVVLAIAVLSFGTYFISCSDNSKSTDSKDTNIVKEPVTPIATTDASKVSVVDNKTAYVPAADEKKEDNSAISVTEDKKETTEQSTTDAKPEETKNESDKPESEETKPEASPESDETKPEASPESDETKPEASPESDETKPEASPESDETKPEAKPESDGNENQSDENEKQSDENEKQSDETKPEDDDTKLEVFEDIIFCCSYNDGKLNPVEGEVFLAKSISEVEQSSSETVEIIEKNVTEVSKSIWEKHGAYMMTAGGVSIVFIAVYCFKTFASAGPVLP